MKKLNIRMLSQATSVDGQGVGSAYMEQVGLVKEQKDLFNVYENKLPSKVKADINHMHTVDLNSRFRIRKKIPTIMYVHFLPTTLDGSIKLPKPIFHIFKKYVVSTYKRADEIVVVNPIFIDPLVELGIKRENITYIPNYVSKDDFYKLPKEQVLASRKEYGIKEDAFVVVGCGQIQTRKGVKDFIEVAKKNKDMTFIWAGGFSFGKITDGYEELKKIVENPPENVKFIGLVKRNKMNEIFNMSDVLFMPSFNELFPMAILEAINIGIPLLLRDLDLYKDILFNKYAAGSNIDEFSNLLYDLRDNSFDKYSKYSLEISQYYSKEHVAEIWRKYYVDIYNKYQEKK